MSDFDETVRAALEALLEERQRQVNEENYQRRLARGARDGRGSGPLPYGYKIGPAPDPPFSQIVIDDYQADVIRRIFAWHRRGHTAHQIAAWLFDEGVHTSGGKRFDFIAVYKILWKEELYQEGKRYYAGTLAAQRWPIILDPLPPD